MKPTPTPIEATTPAADAATTAAEPALQGEGNYSASRRYRKSVEQFVEAGKVDAAAHDAAPADASQARELQEAEEAGRAHARK